MVYNIFDKKKSYQRGLKIEKKNSVDRGCTINSKVKSGVFIIKKNHIALFWILAECDMLRATEKDQRHRVLESDQEKNYFFRTLNN